MIATDAIRGLVRVQVATESRSDGICHVGCEINVERQSVGRACGLGVWARRVDWGIVRGAVNGAPSELGIALR